MQAHPFPEPDSPELEHYLVRELVDKVALLKEIAFTETPVTVFTSDDGACFVSRVASVDAPSGYLCLDMPSTDAMQGHTLPAAFWTCVLFQDGVKVQFRIPQGQVHVQGAHVCWRSTLPSHLIRLQRRLSPRLKTSAQNPPLCLVQWQDQPSRFHALRVSNISLGGLSLVDVPDQSGLGVGMDLCLCYLDLPEIGVARVGLRVLNAYLQDAANEQNQFGCQFMDLSAQAKNLIQRYMNALQAS